MKTLLQKIDQRLLPQTERYRYSPYVWLIYMAFFFISFFAVKREAYQYFAMVVGTLTFLYLYFNIYWVKQNRVKYNIMGIVAIASLMTFLTQGSSVLFVYAGAFCCMLGSPSKAFKAIAAIIVWVISMSLMFKLTPYFYLPAIVFTTFIGGINIYQHEIDKKNKALELSQQEVQQLAKTAERERIARDLHDLIGHTFSVITLKADLAGKLIDRDPERAKTELKELENISRGALSQVREVVSEFRSVDIASALASTKYLLQSNDINFDYSLCPLEIDDNLNKELAVILKELTTNIIKHADATKVTAKVEQNQQGLSISMYDNGKGFSQQKSHGFGLQGIQERLARWQGSLTVKGDKGCEVDIFIDKKQLRQA